MIDTDQMIAATNMAIVITALPDLISRALSRRAKECEAIAEEETETDV